MSISIEVKGLAELKARLTRLPQAIQRKISKGMVATGAAVFKDEAIRRAPVYTGPVQKGHPPPGTLRNAIYQQRIRSESFGTREVWRVSVYRGKEDKKNNVDAYYAHMVEYGSVKMAARPFMRPAFEVQKENVTRIMGAYLAFALPPVFEGLK